VEVLGRVLVLGRITATDMPTFKTKPQVHPGIVHLETFFATLSAGSDGQIRFFDVFTNASHSSLLLAAKVTSSIKSAACIAFFCFLSGRYRLFDAAQASRDSKVACS
jgi:hypothetical protein